MFDAQLYDTCVQLTCRLEQPPCCPTGCTAIVVDLDTDDEGSDDDDVSDDDDGCDDDNIAD